MAKCKALGSAVKGLNNEQAYSNRVEELIYLLCLSSGMHGIARALHGYKITWVYVCLSVCLPVCLSAIPIVHDSDRSFCPIFLKFETTKTKFKSQ